MKRLWLALVSGLIFVAPARADWFNDFSQNPLTDASVLVLGPDKANAASRFTSNADGTLTAHYDTTLPTIKLVFPLGGPSLTQDTSFTLSTRFKLLSGGTVPMEFGASVAAFGMLNSTTTGDRRNSTGYYDQSWNYVVATPGDTYDMMTFDYYPTQDPSYGGNTVGLTVVRTAKAGAAFSDYMNPGNSSLSMGYQLDTLTENQFLTAELKYDATTHQATLNWDANAITLDLTGASFNLDSFGMTLWHDDNLNPPTPAQGYGSQVTADVVFDSFSVVVTPEPGSLALLAGGTLALLRRAGRRRA